MTFFELAEIETREALASYFGVSAPTVHRWVSSGEYPNYVDIVISLYEKIDKLKASIEDKDMIYKELLSKVRTYKVSQDDLFSVIP
jgi:DNA-binding transcriptional regulator LsrR (DeoR family)